MSSRRENYSYCGYLGVLVIFGLLECVSAAFNSSNHSLLPTSSLVTNVTTSFSHVLVTPSLTTPNVTSSARVHHGTQSTTISVSSTTTVVPLVSPNATTTPKVKGKPPPKSKLSSFGIVMLSLGGILIVGMVVCLLVICCRGRERGPEGAHVPHSNVKMKPWKSSELSTTNELTEDTVDVLDKPNHSQSHHNSGLKSSPHTSPILSVPSASNNNVISTPTGTFRESKMI